MATLDDVRRRARVSAGTVSNVLNDKPLVSEATRQRVWAAIEEVGYYPNRIAQDLARGKTQTLGVLVPSLSNPYFAEVVETLEAEADAEKYELMLALSRGQPRRGVRHLERFTSRWVDGVIVMGGAAPTADVLALAKSGKPVVLSGWGPESTGPDIARVEIDLRQAGEVATQLLLDRGHRRIAAILELPVQQTRLDGYRATLERASVRVPSKYLQRGDSSFTGGLRAMNALLALPTPPSAVFAGNDAMALGAMQAAYAAGKKIPGDLAVVGVDDVAEAGRAHPTLTTVRIPKHELAEMMIRLILGLIEKKASPEQHVLTPELIPRESA
jgi:LacI family transcriptional regulator